MASTEQIFQSYVNKDYNQLFQSASASYNKVFGIFNAVYEDGRKAVESLLALVFTSVCADGQLTPKEGEFLNEIAQTNYTHDQLMQIVKGHGNATAYAKADGIFDSMPEGIKAELLNLCLCVCAIDERISPEEVAFVTQLVG